MNNNNSNEFSNSNNIDANEMASSNLGVSEVNSSSVPTVESSNKGVNDNHNTQEENDTDLIISFVGEKYNKICNNTFSVPAFFLTYIYYFYRKMYLFGFLIIAINLFILCTPLIIFGLGINVVIGLFTNKIYLKFATSKVNKIKAKNPDATNLTELCAKKGGTDVIGSIIVTIAVYAFLYVVIVIIVYAEAVIFLLGGTSSIFTKNANQYDGVLYYGDTNVVEQFEVTLPAEFTSEESSDTELNYAYDTKTSNVFSKCIFNFSSIANFSSSKKLINSMAEYNEVDSAVEKTTINGIDWYTFELTDDFGQTYYYATKKGKKVYLAEYQTEQEADINICNQYKDTIINSITSK